MSGDSNVPSQAESKPAETTVPPTTVPLDKPVVNEDAAYGYDCYPERLGNKYVPTWTETMLGRGKEESEKVKCEERVWNVAKSHPLVQLMMSALDKSGCAIDLRRHVACEVCDTTVTGGYDIENNQIVVCQNMCKSDNLTAGVLTHEMIHMFDHCRNHIDFKDMEHLACTEIKAANLTHCSFITSVAHGSSSLINVKETHAECVKVKAAWSVVAVHKVPIDVAKSVVNHVFDKCYQDLEPIGRRCRRNSLDPYMAYRERQHYGY